METVVKTATAVMDGQVAHLLEQCIFFVLVLSGYLDRPYFLFRFCGLQRQAESYSQRHRGGHRESIWICERRVFQLAQSV
jgi:hypothetical protein